MSEESLVIELQEDCLDRDKRSSDLLRKALVISRKLCLQNIEVWLQYELNGYPDDNDKIPDYREVQGQVRVRNPYHGFQPLGFTDPKEAEFHSKRKIKQPISELEALLENNIDCLQVPFPESLVNHLMDGMKVPLRPTLIVPFTEVIGILDSVRNLILDWTLEVENEGMIGEGMTISDSEEKAESMEPTQTLQGHAHHKAHIDNPPGSGRSLLRIREQKLSKELETLLTESSGERGLCKFVKKNPFVLIKSLSYMGNPTRVISEFRLGNEFVADFVVLAPFSGGVEVMLIEVEPPSSSIFNKDGSLAKRANKAVEQVNSWRQYIDKNRQQFIRDLARYAKERDLIKEHVDEMTCTAGWPLHHPRMSFYYTYVIIIGRREPLKDQNLERKAAFRKNNNVEIVTCDRLLTGTRKIDRNPKQYL